MPPSKVNAKKEAGKARKDDKKVGEPSTIPAPTTSHPSSTL
jgi:beta-glucosidase-like glycosyl hydrolase